VTSIPLQQDEIKVCDVRELGGWEAMDAYRAAFTAANADELTGRGSAVYYVRQPALETVIARRMRVRAVISIHHALLTGISLGEIVAHVLGSSRSDVAKRWRSRSDGQLGLNAQCPGLGWASASMTRSLPSSGLIHSIRAATGGWAAAPVRGWTRK
jgi:hypothetical protein